MNKVSILAAFFLFASFSLSAGPEIFDPLASWKSTAAPERHPLKETVTAKNNTEIARYKYDGKMLKRIDYFTLEKVHGVDKEILAGYTVFEYNKGLLQNETLFDSQENKTEEIQYLYRKSILDKTLIHDIKGRARIEWRYAYDKEGNLAHGRRLLSGKTTESFRLSKTPTGTMQSIYNAHGELTSKVESIYENGLLTLRIKTGLVGTQYAAYKYNSAKQLVEIVFHDTVRGEKVLVKKHTIEYSLDAASARTAMK